MAYTSGTITIYSNDGSTVLYNDNSDTSLKELTITETGVTYDSYEYVYEGAKKFIGLSTEANATEPTYGIGDTYTCRQSTAEVFYIVEQEISGSKVNITYNGTVIATLNKGESKVIKCANKKMLTDLEIEVVEEVQLGTFNIVDNTNNGAITTYQFEEGMTWEEFINSEYNTDNIFQCSTIVCWDSHAESLHNEDSSYVYITETIINGGNYYQKPFSPGGGVN